MITRVVSAVIAVAIVISATWFFPGAGLYVVATLAVLGCIYEYSRLTLTKGNAPLNFRIVFMIAAVLIYVMTALRVPLNSFGYLDPDFALPLISISAVILLAMCVLQVRRSPDLGHAFKLQGAAVIGLIYVGLFPGFVVSLIGLPYGLTHFFGLLAIVFAGDTFAYFFGRTLGKRKLLEAVSPKKTVEGSIGGLFGSAVAGFILAWFFLPETLGVSPIHFVLMAVAAGAFAQIGDLFESLIKRLADEKDSGRIMPGHGGFLDRLDGVLFGAPVYYILFKFLA